jgi:hypothetical protein
MVGQQKFWARDLLKNADVIWAKQTLMAMGHPIASMNVRTM